MCTVESVDKAAPLATQGLGATASAFGSYYASKAQKLALAVSADVSDINARMAETAAQQALLSGQREEQRVRLNTANVKSAQRVNLAASGVDISSGSAANVLKSTDVMGEIDALTVKDNAMRQAFGYRARGIDSTNQALMSRAQASAISPETAFATSGLNSYSRMAPAIDKYFKEVDANKNEDPIFAYGKNKNWWAK